MAVCDQKVRRWRIVPAPAPSPPRVLSGVLDVACAEDEEIVWHYTATLEGRFVSGYSIVPRVRTDVLEIVRRACASCETALALSPVRPLSLSG